MRLEADYLTVGSGLAGLLFAAKAAASGSVVVLTKAEPSESNTSYAQGGIAVALDAADSTADHVQDTLAAGDGLCRRQAVEEIIGEGPAALEDLVGLGVRFTRAADGSLALGREGGHGTARVVHAEDATGQEVVRALLAHCRGHRNVDFRAGVLALDLQRDEQGRCVGVWALEARTGAFLEVRARATLLATGGCGQAYRYTTNPEIATGDGIAMAYRAGAQVGNLEFVQFHPTMLHDPGGRSFLISEAVRGYGGVLINHRGERFMDAQHPMGSLATRDVVARAIVAEMAKSGHECVYLDVTGPDPESTRRRFPNIHRHCLSIGVDMTRQPIPVVPAAHYMCGGVVTDLQGRTDIPGLYASGEVAMTGFHGANRLASNSLLEALVLSRRAFARASQDACTSGPANPRHQAADGQAPADPGVVRTLRQQLQVCMWDNVGIVRSDRRLAQACAEVEGILARVEGLGRRHRLDPGLAELGNLALVAALIARSARSRLESRGGHYNQDHPLRDDAAWAYPTVLAGRAQAAAP
ncbi:MAG: L-aspartate oxidase [Candidatus Latescibacterota bacterium]